MRREKGHSRNGKARKDKFSFRAGARVSGVKPDVVGRELARIRKEHGGIKPEVVIDEARDETSPLHPVFTWDDSKAAHEYRLWQARALIRAVCVISADQPDLTPRAVYVHVPDDESYQPMSVVVGMPEMFDSALAELKIKLASAQRSVDELMSAANDEIDPKRVLKIKRVGKAIERAAVAAAAV
jgi:hypothetical protein